MRRASTVFMSAFAVVAIAFVAVVSMSAQEIGGNAEARKMKNPVAANQASIDAGHRERTEQRAGDGATFWLILRGHGIR